MNLLCRFSGVLCPQHTWVRTQLFPLKIKVPKSIQTNIEDLYQLYYTRLADHSSSILCLISRFFNLLTLPTGLTASFVNDNTEYTISLPALEVHSFYCELNDSIPWADYWSKYYYVPKFLRVSFSMLNLTTQRVGPFFTEYCVNETHFEQDFELLCNFDAHFQNLLKDEYLLFYPTLSGLTMVEFVPQCSSGVTDGVVGTIDDINLIDLEQSCTIEKGDVDIDLSLDDEPPVVQPLTLVNVYLKELEQEPDFQYVTSRILPLLKAIVGSTRKSNLKKSNSNYRQFKALLLTVMRIFYAFEVAGSLLDDMITLCIQFCEEKKSDFFIIQGGTGTGKSTLTPLVATCTFYPKQILLVQSRIAAVKGIVDYVSKCSNIKCSENQLITASHRLVNRDRYPPPERVSLIVETGGITQTRLNRGENFKNFGLILIDEAHERTVHADLLLGLLKQNRNKGIKIPFGIVSATIQTEEFEEYFRSSEPEIKISKFNCPSKQFPVFCFNLFGPYNPLEDNHYVFTDEEQKKCLADDIDEFSEDTDEDTDTDIESMDHYLNPHQSLRTLCSQSQLEYIDIIESEFYRWSKNIVLKKTQRLYCNSYLQSH
ncbi:hypothetical protein RCL1_002207 [Eukaryota sp. TZLM3-RCL]